MHCSYLTKGDEINHADYKQSAPGGVAVVLAGGLVIGADTSSAFAQDTTTATPGYVVGPGGSGTTYFSGPATYGPDNLHLCTESSYDLGRYGPVSFCASDVPLAVTLVEDGLACLIGGIGSSVFYSTPNTYVKSGGQAFAVGCAGAEALGWLNYVGDLTVPKVGK